MFEIPEKSVSWLMTFILNVPPYQKALVTSLSAYGFKGPYVASVLASVMVSLHHLYRSKVDIPPILSIKGRISLTMRRFISSSDVPVKVGGKACTILLAWPKPPDPDCIKCKIFLSWAPAMLLMLKSRSGSKEIVLLFRWTACMRSGELTM